MKVFFGWEEILIPAYNNLGTAVEKHLEADVVINFASFRSAYNVSIEALNYPTIKTLVIIADVISLLWFKERLPKYVTEFLELALKITADHDPCMSAAHNTIVTTMAGKDFTAAVASGVLTISPRFGGAIDGAAKYFKNALERGLTPRQFVDEMKTVGVNIPGIGYRVKSVQNPDMRVKLLEEWAYANLPKHELLDFALGVEKITTAKRNNLILNVDGGV
ncbi:MAG: citrate/2-methylcitrate synthase [Methanocellales archaeon]|nr:citrate/2-methylcitrate synthase [Methanocellales archaeon]